MKSLLTIYGIRTPVDGNWEICMADITSGLSKFPWKRKNRKIHFLLSHLNFFPPNLVAVSDEHGERFHQDISTTERWYAGKWSQNVSWLLLEPHWTGGYCQLRTDGLQKEGLSVSKFKHLFSYFCYVISWSYCYTALLPLFFNSLSSFHNEKVILNKRTQLHNNRF